MNTLIFLTNIFDPRDKLEYIEFSLKQMYGDDTGLTLYNIMKSDLTLLFDEYMVLYGFASSGSHSKACSPFDMHVPNPRKSMSLLKA